MISQFGGLNFKQLVIEDGNMIYLQSDDDIICKYDQSRKKLYLYDRLWNASKTTRQYFKNFINSYTHFNYNTKKGFEKEIIKNNKIETID